MEDWERDFAAYVEGRRMALRGTAYLLCGDWHPDVPAAAAGSEVRARDPMAVSQPAGAVSPGVCSSAGSTGTAPVPSVDR